MLREQKNKRAKKMRNKGNLEIALSMGANGLNRTELGTKQGGRSN
jgi:hypothetical protein